MGIRSTVDATPELRSREDSDFPVKSGRMERDQELEWKAAQSIVISVDLVSAAKRQLKFLAAVDRNRCLYEEPGLDRAIYRYNAFWLPLLAKHSESPLFEGPMVVPLDCEWIWHCHRLNPVQYKSDCEELYGRILENHNVVSSVDDDTSRGQTEEIWKSLYPDEPFELDFNNVHQGNLCGKNLGGEKCTKYDLISAVQRQSPFFFQVSRRHMTDNRFLEGSVARYKGFLHLIKRNKEKSIRSFSVPTYDIDLIWHSHQLYPVSYCTDLVKILGKILEHDDTDSDRAKGQKLDIGFFGTTKTFEEMYGTRYWRAGSMYRGLAPSPVRTTPYSGISSKKVSFLNENQKIKLPHTKVLEVMLEIVAVQNVLEQHIGRVFVTFSKTQPDVVFNSKRCIEILSESEKKQVASFHCQPTGHLLLELMLHIPNSLSLSKSSKVIGTTSICLEDFLSPDCDLMVEKWLELVPSSNTAEPKPIGLRVALSVTTPTTPPYVLHMINSKPLRSSCMFPLPFSLRFAKSWVHVIDEAGDQIMNLQMRDCKRSVGRKDESRREVVGIMDSGKKCTLAVFSGSEWSLPNSPWSLQLPNSDNGDDHLLELTGPQTVRLYPGGRLDYEKRLCEMHRSEQKLERHLITAVEFSEVHPYGRAMALLDLHSGTVKVEDECFLIPALILTFVLSKTLRMEGCIDHIIGLKSVKKKGSPHETILESNKKKVDAGVEAINRNAPLPPKHGCLNGCGDAVRALESGGCGSGGCGNMAQCGGCGGSGGCGGCGGSGCGNMFKSSGCGGCGGCGYKLGNASGGEEHHDQVVIHGNEILVA